MILLICIKHSRGLDSNLNCLDCNKIPELIGIWHNGSYIKFRKEI